MIALKLSDIVAQSSKKWGEERTEGVPFGLLPTDNVSGGLDIEAGGLYSIQGNEGSRKTSLALNILINQCLSGKLPEKYAIEWDSLESGMTIQRVAHVIISILANRYMTLWFHTKMFDETDYHKLMAAFSVQNGERAILEVTKTENDRTFQENVIKPERLVRGRYTPFQRKAIEVAWGVANTFPVILSGVSEDRRHLAERESRLYVPSVATTNLEESAERWERHALEFDVRELWCDHIGKYDLPGSDYDVMKAFIRASTRWLAKESGRTVWALCQVGTAQRQAYRSSEYELPSARGGALVAEESMLAYHLKYNWRITPYWVRVNMAKSRIGVHDDMYVPIERESGAMFGSLAVLGRPPGVDKQL